MNNLRIIGVAATALLMQGAVASASTITTSTPSDGNIWKVNNIETWQTSGNKMGGMIVDAFFSDGSTQSVNWINGGGALGSDWSLTMNTYIGNTYDNTTNWILANTNTEKYITGLVIEGMNGSDDYGTVFDINDIGILTPGSMYGKSIASADTNNTLLVSANYSNFVALNGSNNSLPYGDLYHTLTLTFSHGLDSSGFGTNDTFAFIADTDNVNTSPVPEPATMILFGVGLAGLAGVRTRKRK